MNIYVSNLDCNRTRGQLRAAFAVHGAVNAVSIVSDRCKSRYRNVGLIDVTSQILKTVDGSIWSELKGTENRLPVVDEGRIPDFFDHWMEELFELRCKRDGHALEDWLQAESEILSPAPDGRQPIQDFRPTAAALLFPL